MSRVVKKGLPFRTHPVIFAREDENARSRGQQSRARSTGNIKASLSSRRSDNRFLSPKLYSPVYFKGRGGGFMKSLCVQT